MRPGSRARKRTATPTDKRRAATMPTIPAEASSWPARPAAGAGRGGGGGGGGGNVVSADRIVYFEYDSANIRAESRPVIAANARALTNNRRSVTQLEGHTDERGSREYNIALGERRANAVRQAMTAMGVSPQQIRVVSYGEERPAAAGQDEQSYALNRRVEIVY
ncbi:MAG: peptidoglycan-associated lipoprotein Pal [Candidatus Competibacteraceae bacterium]|nr:peptidoglycan-associated lipoprotein Pal [Candidatus Competibacteraceae bacterium]